jgi:hypothetical protein
MPKKTLLSLFVALFVFAIYSQLSGIKAHAQFFPLTGPITAPTTSPTITVTPTPTVSPTPVTPPLTSFNIGGKVVIKQLGRLLSGMQRIIPAPNVMVTVRNLFSRAVVAQGKTDSNGNYAFTVPSGIYFVEVDEPNNTIMVPPLTVVSLKNKPVTKNFQALQFNLF